VQLFVLHLLFLSVSLIFLYIIKNKNYIGIAHNTTSFFSLLLSLIIFTQRDHLLGREVEIIEVFDGATISFYLDDISLMFLMVSNFLWFLTSLYATRYLNLNNYDSKNTFYLFFLFSMFATNSIIYSSNLFTIFIFYEILTLSTYPLVTLDKKLNSMISGKKYLFILLGTSIIFLLPAIILTYNLTGNISFLNTNNFANTDEVTILFILLLFIFGTAKSAIMPFHRWLPNAMVAPTPVSALLHAVAVVKSGVFILIKVFLLIFGVNVLSNINTQLVILIISTTIVLSSFVALRHDSIKLRLAYSTVGQLSYILLGIIILTPYSIIAALLHFIFHALGKIILFLSAGIFATNCKIKNVSEMNGLASCAPLTCLSMTLGALIMIGLPPTIGFISKWYLLVGVTNSENYVVLGVIMLSTILNAGYYFPMIYKVYFKEISNQSVTKNSEDRYLVAPVLFITILSFSLFFYSEILISFINNIGVIK